MHKIMTVSENDILYDVKAVSLRIQDICARSPGWRVTGGGTVHGELILSLEHQDETKCVQYYLVEFSECGHAAVTAEISRRYYAGFALICLFEMRNRAWALLAEEGVHGSD